MILRLDSLLGIARGLLPACMGSLPPVYAGGLGRFPPCLGWLGVEARLDAEPTLDLAVSVDGRGPGRLVLAAAADLLRADLPERWQPTLVAVDDWAAARDPATAAATELWFEVDAGGEDRPPIVFFTMVGADNAAVDALLAATALRRLGAPDPAIERLARARSDWSPDVHLHHLASLTPRGRSALRVVASAPSEVLVPTLAGLGWVGDATGLGELLDALGDWTGRVSFDLDLDDDPPRRLGIEWHLPSSPRTDPRWQCAFTAARELAGASPEKIDAVREWAEDIALGERVTIHRYLHLKFVFRPASAPTAKGYLGLTAQLRGT